MSCTMNKLSKVSLVTGVGVLLGNCFNASATSFNQDYINLLQTRFGVQNQGEQQVNLGGLKPLDQESLDKTLDVIQATLDLSQQPILYLQPHIEQKPYRIHEWSNNEKEHLKQGIEDYYTGMGISKKWNSLPNKDCQNFLAKSFDVTDFDVELQIIKLGNEDLRSKVPDFLKDYPDYAPSTSDIQQLASSTIYGTCSMVTCIILEMRGCNNRDKELTNTIQKEKLIDEFKEKVLEMYKPLKSNKITQVGFKIAYELKVPLALVRSILSRINKEKKTEKDRV